LLRSRSLLGRPGGAIITQATTTTAESLTRRMLGAHLARPTRSSPPAPWPCPNASACRSVARACQALRLAPGRRAGPSSAPVWREDLGADHPRQVPLASRLGLLSTLEPAVSR